MPSATDQREVIQACLKGFITQPFPKAARKLLGILGYESARRLPIDSATQFRKQLDPGDKLTERQCEALNQLISLHLLFQITDTELDIQGDLLDDPTAVHSTKIESYIFFAAELPPGHYTRTTLATLVRAINKPLPMPALVLFRHGDAISIGIIHRRLNKRDQARDVLEKVTLIKDIALDDPIRAHIEILNDLVLSNLDSDFYVSNFVSLHKAWQKRLNSYSLSDNFYREIADWYFWAHHQVDDGVIRLPLHCDTEQENSLFLIRLLTRVIFCWFLVEKRLIPTDLFREHRLKDLLKDYIPTKNKQKPDTGPSYYRAILQNLFFGTLNMPIELRAFREKKKAGERYDQNYGITNLWRYEASFRDPADWIALADRIPFLNGGLFDCLDDKTGKKKDNFILDGFSDREDFGCHLPNDLFFGPERTVDLSRDYGEEKKRTARSKKAKVHGLIEILSRYKFTVEENTPLEEEIALDPELLGKVFENLLASYNEDTRTTARKALGAFYTPREIVSYMVDEALKSYLATQVPRCKGALEDLFSNKATLKEIKPDTRNALIAAIGRVKILDPACGSGAFPMGALHRLVDLLQKLDPNNESWKRDRLAEARRYHELLVESGASKDETADCDVRIVDIEKSFDTRFHALDFARKLYLIENSIYGVDIQPIATQISKLRFFISLVVDQKMDPKAHNLGVRPLPNLETRIVAADTLIPIEKSESDLFSGEIDTLRAELATIRHKHFNARTPTEKRKWRDADANKRKELATLLEREHAIPRDSARKLATWDPYDQNEFAHFFDSEWMFGKIKTEVDLHTEGHTNNGVFDIVIGNPPYVRQEKIKHLKPIFQGSYPNTYTGTADLYVYFYAQALNLLRPNGTLSYITSNSFINSVFGKKLRGLLAGTTRILVIVDFAEAKVFKAITEPCILIATKGYSLNNSIKALRWKQDKKPEDFASELISNSFMLPQETLSEKPWQLEVSQIREIIDSLRECHPSLQEVLNNRNFYGVKTGCNDAFLIDQITRDRLIREHPKSADLIKPYLRGRDIRPWRPSYAGQWMIFTRHGTNIDAYPAIKKHLIKFKSRLEPRPPKWPTGKAWKGRKPGQYKWFEIQDNVAYFAEFSRPKIIYQEINRTDTFAYDDKGYFLNNKLFMLPDAPLWLLGILNSRTASFFLHRSTGVPKGGFLALQWPVLAPLPIALPKKHQEETFTRLVKILCCMHSNTESQSIRDPLMVAYWEQVLNGLVYELYFPEEIHGAGLMLFDLVKQANLPDVNTSPIIEDINQLRDKFEKLYDIEHPLRAALFSLGNIDVVRIIEGKE